MNRRQFLGGLVSGPLVPMIDNSYVVPLSTIEKPQQKIIIELDGKILAEAILPTIKDLTRRRCGVA
jgi:hypothetical protein